VISLSSIARYTVPDSQAERHAICELCSGPLHDTHRHVVSRGERGVHCACRACALLFDRSDVQTPYRTIPERVRKADDFAMTATRMAELGIPVTLAICYRDSIRDHGIVCYPGPAGMTEAELEPVAWDAICASTSLARDLADDVEALLVRGSRGNQALSCYLVPISTAYELVARLRRVWQGFGGGGLADAELRTVFEDLDRRGGSR
jgi:uncharacterized protein DUF5947